MAADPRFKRGARRSPAHKLLAAEPHRVIAAPPPQVAYVPAQLSMWGNDQYGDCVTAEEAFAKATYAPEIFIPDQVVIDHARAHGVLEGATLTEVLDVFKAGNGFKIASQEYGDGPYNSVDYSNETVLQSAIALGPVKIAIDAGALPSGAGNQSGWHATGRGHYPNTDHCVALCGYGPAAWLYQQLHLPLPSGLPTSGYLLYTWNTIGFVDHAWLMGTCTEAWVRNPTTVGVPPLSPPPPPPPPPPPGPTLQQQIDAVFAALERTEPFYLVWALQWVNRLIDQYLQQHPNGRQVAASVGALPIPPAVLKAIFDGLCDGLRVWQPQLAWLVNLVQPIVDRWLDSQR